MNATELAALVGNPITIRSTRHICVAAGNNALLLLQFVDDGKPLQYIVAHRPHLYGDELVWDSGEYFPLFNYSDSGSAMSTALCDASLALNGGSLYVAMADNDLGAFCVGAYLRKQNAFDAIETALNADNEVKALLAERGMGRVSLDVYKCLYDELELENSYWVEEINVNQAPVC